jgi:diacylglycerol kinase (ATP)
MNNEPVLFIINKFAGAGFLPKVEGKILDIAAKHNAECTIEFTRARGHATELAIEGIGKGFKKIIAVGGDGTVNEVAQGIVTTDTLMGIVPKGSGNGLSRHMGIPLQFEKAVENIFTGSTIRIDTFLVNNRLSLNVSGVGFDGHVANQFGKNGKRGLFGYIKLTLKEFISFQEFAAELLVDGINHNVEAFIIAIANSSQYGNNARIAPIASVVDQKLHLAVLKKIPAWASIPFLVRFFAGLIHTSRFCELLEGQHIEIKTNVVRPYHIDGEPCGWSDHFQIIVQPRSLSLLIPKSTTPI